MIELTPKLIYEDLYASAYKDLLMYGLSEDQSSRKANIYAVKNTWKFFTSEDKECKIYRRALFYKYNPIDIIETQQNLIKLQKQNAKEIK